MLWESVTSNFFQNNINFSIYDVSRSIPSGLLLTGIHSLRQALIYKSDKQGKNVVRFIIYQSMLCLVFQARDRCTLRESFTCFGNYWKNIEDFSKLHYKRNQEGGWNERKRTCWERRSKEDIEGRKGREIICEERREEWCGREAKR